MSNINHKKRIGVLRGGEGDYDDSLRRGGEAIAHIFDNLSHKYDVVDIFIDKDNVWHMGGVEILPSDLLHRVDVVWNTAHHMHNNILDNLSIPNVGISSFASLLQNDTSMLEKHIAELNLKTPKRILLPIYQEDFDARPTEGSRSFGQGEVDKYILRKAKEIHQKFGAPWIVRALSSNGMGIHVATTFHQLINAIEDGVKHKKSIVIEELISGHNVDTHSLGGYRGEDVYVFPARNATHNVAGGPPKIHKDEKNNIIQIAKDLHRHLGAEHYLKSSFVIHPNRGVFLTDISFMPDLHTHSDLHKVSVDVGSKMHYIIEHILEKVASKR